MSHSRSALAAAFQRRRSASLTAVALVVAMATSMLSVSIASAQQAPPEPIGTAEFCANAPSDTTFEDVESSVFTEEIICLELLGITHGTTVSMYEPANGVTRGQMASFIARLLGTAHELRVGSVAELPDSPPDAFTDVEASSPHARSINQLAAENIVLGGPGGHPADQYGPNLTITRAQMASLIDRAIGFATGEPLSTDQEFFTDVPSDHVHADAINALASVGISVGVGNNQYNPEAPVTRGQMAGFLVRTLALLNDRGVIAPPPPPAMATFEATLGALNDSGASGTASVEVNGSLATVTIEIAGASPDLPHAQHIHIGGANECPTIAADSNGDGFVSTPEGIPSYGEIAVSLTVDGDTSPASALAVDRMPVGSDTGAVTYQRTFRLPGDVTAADVGNGVIVSHGVADTTLGSDPATYDGPDSPLAEGVPQEATLPSSCGALAPASPQNFEAVLGPLNGSGASGTASVEVNGSLATVTIEIAGASPDLPHAQHIHIGGANECPTIAADSNGDGFVSTPEGIPSYGEIAVSLTVDGDTSPASALAVARMPVGSDAGVVTYQRTFRLPAGVTGADVGNGVVVSHGVAETTLGSDPATYDGPDSPLAEGVPQEATLPSSCGALNPA